MSGVVLDNLSKRFGDVQALRELTLEIEDGEFFSLLGPSGCGKTTTLRLIAGFEEPTTGRVLLGGTDVTEQPPHRRPVNTVFQNYALFPHLSVKENVAFGLRFSDLGRKEKNQKVADALSLVQLEGFERRKPTQLSGGEQQRVALARALILNPRVLLLDEPLGALDAKLRRALQIELKTLQQEVGVTFVYVTHDQEEALTMSDRMAVMSRGLAQQIGTPNDIYEEPENEFVADFLGISNLMAAEAHGRGIVSLGDTTLRAGRGDLDATGPVKVTIRPERIQLEALAPETENHLRGMVTRLVYLGSTSRALVELAHGDVLQVLLTVDAKMHLREGMPLLVHLPTDCLRILAASEAEAVADGRL
jgi:spermidine/putrescine transport system ATP-binding protein